VVDGGCVGLDGAAAGCPGVGEAGEADAGSAGDAGAGDAGDGDAGEAVAGALGVAGEVLAGDDGIACGSALGEAVALAAVDAPLIAAANAVRLARAVVSLALVSSSSVTAAAALDGDVPEVPTGFASDDAAAPGAPVEGVSARSSAKILSACAASDAHFAEAALLAFTSALAVLAPASWAVIFSIALTCFFKSAICDLAVPVTALPEMLFRAALASCRCCCGIP